MSQISFAGTDESSWLVITEPGIYRIDVDVPTGLTVSYTIETDRVDGDTPKTAKTPGDIATDWTLDASQDFEVKCPCQLRLNVASRSGNSNPLVMTATQLVAGFSS